MTSEPIGILGLGKLGYPVAVTLGQKVPVIGYDIDPKKGRERPYPHKELGPTLKNDFQDYADRADLIVVDTVQEVTKSCKLIFVAVQTPHQPEYEGITRLPEQRADFDYSHLVRAVDSLREYVRPGQTVVVISTVLPGTMRREVLPLLPEGVGFVYNPFFIAMGTVMKDFLQPEFVLLGGDDLKVLNTVDQFYREFYYSGSMFPAMVEPSIKKMTIESAELTKVAYNTFISAKIAFANHLMEICHKIPGADVDEVTDALAHATDRVISLKYMRGGMGDGGGCHPRDNIAMSWLASKLFLSYDLCGEMMKAREKQAEWIVDLIEFHSRFDGSHQLPVVLLGKAYKPESNLTTGSPALLVANMLRERGIPFSHCDPFTDKDPPNAFPVAVYLIATKHQEFQRIAYPRGSVIVDPFRYISDQSGVKVVRIGAK